MWEGGHQSALPVCGERQGRPDVFPLQVWEIGQDFVLGHARCQVLQHVIYGDAQTANARFPARFPGSTVMIFV